MVPSYIHLPSTSLGRASGLVTYGKHADATTSVAMPQEGAVLEDSSNHAVHPLCIGNLDKKPNHKGPKDSSSFRHYKSFSTERILTQESGSQESGGVNIANILCNPSFSLNVCPSIQRWCRGVASPLIKIFASLGQSSGQGRLWGWETPQPQWLHFTHLPSELSQALLSGITRGQGAKLVNDGQNAVATMPVASA
jgi:hypothetical protein